eukprot:TRINITY_DN0_c2336_g1_i4.p1 TRINITY_DN0_c2336_g1~~TRINITY_DN0_c2336_g1_i4.p1  ORF type:complete len:186 (-),score=14.50 TRINITY_DN0_c2336_g1_i4:49-606(-)
MYSALLELVKIKSVPNSDRALCSTIYEAIKGRVVSAPPCPKAFNVFCKFARGAIDGIAGSVIDTVAEKPFNSICQLALDVIKRQLKISVSEWIRRADNLVKQTTNVACGMITCTNTKSKCKTVSKGFNMLVDGICTVKSIFGGLADEAGQAMEQCPTEEFATTTKKIDFLQVAPFVCAIAASLSI